MYFAVYHRIGWGRDKKRAQASTSAAAAVEHSLIGLIVMRTQADAFGCRPDIKQGKGILPVI